MFWIALFVIACLAGVAYGWISVTSNRDRILISLEIGKVRPAFEQLKHASERLFHK